MIWNDVKSIVVVALNYSPGLNPLTYNKKRKLNGNISVYAHNFDYHKVIKNKLTEFKKWFRDKYFLDSKIFVDTSPIFEKQLAQMSGIGWQGKHTNLVSKKYGSWLFLAEIFLPIHVLIDKEETNHCGSCDDCIKICPTEAIVEENKIDARRCISYLTIEHKGPFPMSLRKKIGNKIYGCDDCLSICPWNKFSEKTNEKKLLNNNIKSLLFYLNFDKKKFESYFCNSPIKRIGWIRFLRNVIIAVGNSNHKNFIKILEKFVEHENSLIRGSAIWSLSQLLNKNELINLKKKLLKKEKEFLCTLRTRNDQLIYLVHVTYY